MRTFYQLALALLIVALSSISVNAKKNVFYDSKSQLLGISGNVDSLAAYGFEYKIFKNPIQFKVNMPDPANKKKGYQLDNAADVQAIENIAAQLNAQHVGKQVLDYLFQYDPSDTINPLSIELLKQRAAQNAQFLDVEYVQATAQGAANGELAMLTEDPYLMAIFKNNYIYLERHVDDGKRILFAVYRVQLDDELFTDIYNVWNLPEAYNKRDPKVEFVGSGTFKDDSDKHADAVTKISKECEPFAIRGQLKGRNPARAYLGENSGAKYGDRVLIYRQGLDELGNPQSKVVSRARINKIEDGMSQMYFISGTKGSAENGDMVVYSPDKKFSVSIEGTYGLGKWYGASLTVDYLISTLKNSAANIYAMFDARFDFSPKIDKKYLTWGFRSRQNSFDKPIVFDLGLGVGIGYTFLGRLEAVPYAKGQFEYISFSNYNDNGNSMTAYGLRVPVGLKFNLNIAYPVQLTFGAEYPFHFDIDKIDDNDFETKSNSYQVSYKFVMDEIFKASKSRRDKLTFHAGVRIMF